ncbi:hypothetical protein Y032_1079g3561 [Ancylostoma ceylanicum]|uniref:Uncharacterized protein n=1 Tax=Ancylostoma ceylanicum TaxID=53326 RepID=A0A016W8I0_9BILA|nr:hypothetical protein Y032_1079g3561 [Ancylostoma ceylanicum]
MDDPPRNRVDRESYLFARSPHRRVCSRQPAIKNGSNYNYTAVTSCSARRVMHENLRARLVKRRCFKQTACDNDGKIIRKVIT